MVVPDDLKNEFEAFSRQKYRSEAEVMRDAIRSYIASSDATQFLPLEHSLDSVENNTSFPGELKPHPRMPKSFGIASSGRVQSDQFEEWPAANWERGR